MRHRLVERRKHVCEVIARYNRTLINECAAISVVVIRLENSVPMLYKEIKLMFELENSSLQSMSPHPEYHRPGHSEHQLKMCHPSESHFRDNVKGS